jgi:hypothetical protein
MAGGHLPSELLADRPVAGVPASDTAGRMTAVHNARNYTHTHSLPHTYAKARLTSFTHVLNFQDS